MSVNVPTVRVPTPALPGAIVAPLLMTTPPAMVPVPSRNALANTVTPLASDPSTRSVPAFTVVDPV